jgi:hypothetical protein
MQLNGGKLVFVDSGLSDAKSSPLAFSFNVMLRAKRNEESTKVVVVNAIKHVANLHTSVAVLHIPLAIPCFHPFP